MTVVYTIGHSNHSLEHFVELRRRHEIAELADVRSRPYSKWYPHFQKKPLSRSLRDEGTEYVFLGAQLGGRPDGGEFYDTEGRVDYARRAKAPDFQAGIARLEELGKHGRTALMCAEENPVRCHRRLLVTPALEQQGIEVVHIRGDGDLQTEEALCEPSPQLLLFS